MPDNVLIIDSDYEEANGFVKGLKQSTKKSYCNTIELLPTQHRFPSILTCR